MHFRLIFFFRFLQLQLPKKKATWPPKWWCCITYCCTKTYDYPTWSRFWFRVEKWSAILMISCRSCQSSSFYKPQKGIRIDLEVFIRSFYDCVRRISPIYVWSKILSCLTVWKSPKIASIAIICPLPKVRKKMLLLRFLTSTQISLVNRNFPFFFWSFFNNYLRNRSFILTLFKTIQACCNEINAMIREIT